MTREVWRSVALLDHEQVRTVLFGGGCLNLGVYILVVLLREPHVSEKLRINLQYEDPLKFFSRTPFKDGKRWDFAFLMPFLWAFLSDRMSHKSTQMVRRTLVVIGMVLRLGHLRE